MSTTLPKIKYLTIREAAFVLGVPRDHVSRAIRVGVIRAVRRGSGLAVPSSEIVKWLGGAG
ncbi:MAG TPA: excisionase family DNA-binding protein [Actinokineospora sp.]|nr:excisionase family DNA-binding protein [Actinokineospora sp.]